MFCKKCGYELPESSVFCPKCGLKIEGKVESIISGETVVAEEVEKKEKQKEAKFGLKTCINKIPNAKLLMRVSIAVISLLCAVLLLFAPIQKAKVAYNGKAYDTNYTGFDLMKYTLEVVTATEYEDALKMTTQEIKDLYEKYDVTLLEKLSEKEKGKIFKELNVLTLSIASSGMENIVLIIQVVLNGILFILIEVLLIVIGIKSICAIFKEGYEYQKNTKLHTAIVMLILLLATVFKIKADSYTNGFIVSASRISGVSIFILVLQLISLAIIYINEYTNDRIKYNREKVLKTSIAAVLLIISAFVLNGSFIKGSYKNYNLETIKFESFVQTTVNVRDISVNYMYNDLGIIAKGEGAFVESLFGTYNEITSLIYMLGSFIFYAIAMVFVIVTLKNTLLSYFGESKKRKDLLIASIILLVVATVLITLYSSGMVEAIKDLPIYNKAAKIKTSVKFAPIFGLMLLIASVVVERIFGNKKSESK